MKGRSRTVLLAKSNSDGQHGQPRCMSSGEGRAEGEGEGRGGGQRGRGRATCGWSQHCCTGRHGVLCCSDGPMALAPHCAPTELQTTDCVEAVTLSPLLPLASPPSCTEGVAGFEVHACL
jgi:hypothetical protein